MTIWLIIFIFIIIAVIAIIVLWVIWPAVTNTNTNTFGNQTTAGFLAPCNATLQCNTGMTCEEGICLRNIGQNCRVLADCVDEANICKDGTCQTTSTGGLNEQPPCGTNLEVNSVGVCKGIQNFPCLIDGDCLSSICNNGLCTDLRGRGFSCNNNDNCADGRTCSEGYCQSPNIQTGTNGAYCGPEPEQSGCNSGLTCINGICQVNSQQLNEPCNLIDILCMDPYDCINSSCQLPKNNKCNSNMQCSNGQKCRHGHCIASKDQPCYKDDHCPTKCSEKYQILELKDNKLIKTKYPKFDFKPNAMTVENKQLYIIKNNNEIWTYYNKEWILILINNNYQLIDFQGLNIIALKSNKHYLLKIIERQDGSLKIDNILDIDYKAREHDFAGFFQNKKLFNEKYLISQTCQK